MKIQEWKEDKKWNPFNSYKLLTHVERWKLIRRGSKIPPPILVTIDPSNICNLKCEWCNSSYLMSKQKNMLTEKNIREIADFLSNWQDGDYRVNAVCIAGGGEPLTNKNTSLLIDLLVDRGISVGVVTNGYYIDKFLDSLSKCTWVGVSIDAGKSKTFNKLKGLPEDDDKFYKILDNIKLLVDYSEKNKRLLSKKHPAYGVTYKYLLCRENVNEVYDAVKIAKEIGCKNFHLRPTSTPWNLLHSKDEIYFDEKHIKEYKKQIEKSIELDDENFNVYGVTHKFDAQFKRHNKFKDCYAMFMTGVFMPSKEKGKIDFGLCCDRRGDDRLLLVSALDNLEIIQQKWGSEDHWKIFDSIDVQSQCPRCTYQPHNQIYEHVILRDSMTYIFI